MRLGSAGGDGARRLGAAALALGMGVLSWSMYAAGPAGAATGRGSLGLSPSNGPADTTFTATFHLSGAQAACGGQVTFSFDGQPVASAGMDGGCSASASIQVPLGTAPGGHAVRAVATAGAAASATFTVDDTSTQPTSQAQPPQSITIPGQNKPGQPSSSQSSTTQPWYYNNYTTPTTPWHPPAFAPQAIPGVTPGPCDTTGPHAVSSDKSFLSIPAFAVGAHAGPAQAPDAVSEPAAGALPILSVGPPSMLPPQLGVAAYQSLELLEPIDPNISPKLRLAAAAGEPFSCLQVETFGPQGGNYGYLVYALKGALVISVQDANADGTPFVQSLPTVASVPTPAAPSSSAKPGAKKTTAPAATTPTSTAPKAKYETVKLGYSSIQWEYQDAGGANAPAHRGTGTITPPPPHAQLSYSNLVFAFGGLVAATVALMFAYHSRRRDLERRARGRRAARHV